ncbi:phytanoyl-CoA dioxygenase family protein [Nostoc ellipsosporum NOK]|nr:phytanoyl-CoA dioxygenase family protein [Nostoc ellipsosporum NOK]
MIKELSFYLNKVKTKQKYKMLKTNIHQISTQDIEAFERDGVICIKNALDGFWVERMQKAIERNLSDGSMGIHGSNKIERYVVMHDSGIWLKDPDFRALVFESPLANLAAQLLKSEKLNLLCDGFFVKKPEANSRVGWHNDQSYWPVQGWKCCKFWLPLDRVTQENGRLEYIKGSHLWSKELCEHSDASLAFDAEPYEILSWDMEPGDCLVHHFLTIHHSGCNTSSRVRRAIVTNWAGDDVTFKNRPNAWPYQAIEEIDSPEINSLTTLKPGEPIDSAIFPRVEFSRTSVLK